VKLLTSRVLFDYVIVSGIPILVNRDKVY
jgi:hypothetical protein